MPVSGDLLTPRLDVDPFGPDTVATLVVVDPDDTARPDTTRPEMANATWYGTQIRLTAGEYRFHWTVTGTGADTVTQVISVGPSGDDLPEGFSYATTADLVRYSGQALPPGARRSLINASREIERLTKAARYAVDLRGYAVDTVVRKALADATCELVSWWAETGSETGAASLITNASIAGVSIGYGGRAQGNAQADRVGPRIWSILMNANLVGGGGVLYG